MFYDLNVPWSPYNEASLRQTLAFLDELGYNVVALSHTLSGKLTGDLACPIPATLSFPTPTNMRILRRCNLVLSDPSQNHRLSQLAANYDILALRPTTEKALQQACQSEYADIISLDLTIRFDFHFKMKMLALAIENGIKIEICYAPGLTTGNTHARRNVISNATQLIRATRGRGLIISSEAHKAAACRAPFDVINLAAVWGLGQERGKEAVDKLARSVVVASQMKRTSFRGVVDVVYGGEMPKAQEEAKKNDKPIQNKRKADEMESKSKNEMLAAKPVSKRAQKKQRKALLEAEKNNVDDATASAIPAKEEAG